MCGFSVEECEGLVLWLSFFAASFFDYFPTSEAAKGGELCAHALFEGAKNAMAEVEVNETVVRKMRTKNPETGHRIEHESHEREAWKCKGASVYARNVARFWEGCARKDKHSVCYPRQAGERDAFRILRNANARVAQGRGLPDAAAGGHGQGGPITGIPNERWRLRLSSLSSLFRMLLLGIRLRRKKRIAHRRPDGKPDAPPPPQADELGYFTRPHVGERVVFHPDGAQA